MPECTHSSETPQDYNPREGFYARYFTAAELKDLARDTSLDLRGEIDLLKVVFRRFIEEALTEAESFEDWIKILNSLTASATRLDRLVNSQRKLASAQAARDEMHQALSDLLERIKPGIEEEDLN